MKQGNIKNWTDVDSCKNLLLFAELVDELLFDYSIPSNRISTLNSHFLCYDATNAIESIEKAGVPEGTLKPIVSELFSSLKKDVLFTRMGENPLKYFVKYQQRVGYQIIGDPENLNYDEEKKVVHALNQRYFNGNWYIESLKKEIIKLVVGNQEEDWLDLFRMTKSYLTELINIGYNARAILFESHNLFFGENTISKPEIIMEFVNIFSCKKNEYDVIAVVDSSIANLLRKATEQKNVKNSHTPRTKSKKEIDFLAKSKMEKFIIFTEKALDPFAAVDACQRKIDSIVSFRRMFDHDIKYKPDSIRWGVYRSNSWFIKVEKEKSAVQRVKMPSKTQMIQQTENLFKALDNTLRGNNYRDIVALMNALQFHSLSLDSNSKENQLLDLWAIFETLLDIQNNHTSDRIQQVCIYLVPILKRKYIYSLFFQLNYDIKNHSEDWYKRIIGNETDIDEVISRICSFVLLPKFDEQRQAFLRDCKDFPLLKERIEYYRKTLSSPKQIYDFIEKHSERVRWQIMRIYRNRNLIIHNADSMPYLNLLVENLHTYVDDFLQYAIQSLAKSHSLESMCLELFAQECEFMEQFQRGKEKVISEETIERILR